MHRRWPSVRIFATFVVCFALFASGAHGQIQPEKTPWDFTCWRVAEGPLELTLGKLPFITAVNEPQTLTWELKNSSESEVVCRLELTSVDTVYPLDKEGQRTAACGETVTVPAQGQVSGSFAWQAGEGTYSGHYPLRVTVTWNEHGEERTADAVRVIETRLSATTVSDLTTTVIQRGGVSLLTGKSYEAFCEQGGQSRSLGVGFTGNDSETKANLHLYHETRVGEPRFTFAMHPPYIPEGGNLNLRFPVRLPDSERVLLSYGCMLVTPPATEPASDGVTFRILVESEGETAVAEEFHTDSKVWVDRGVDLSPWSGREITLVLQVTPGPANNTTCDGCFVSGLFVNTEEGLSWPQIGAQGTQERQEYQFDLGHGRSVRVLPGPGGLLDAKYIVTTARGELTYDGLRLAVGATRLTDPFTCYAEKPKTTYNESNKVLTSQYTLLLNDEAVPVTVTASVENGMFVLSLPEGNPAEINGLCYGPVSSEPSRSYFAHGYVVEGPQGVRRVSFDGHELASSHVGFDFPGGGAIFMATSIPPQFLEVNPVDKVYSLIASGRVKMALLPNEENAFNAAKEYRENSGWVAAAAPGWERKAGRLVYDIWGVNTRNLIETMTKIFEYGATDSLFIQHVWQRYGYDVRLPDIWNPDADYSDLRELAALCRQYDVPFALHDNYIDLYPDASDFTYDNICFHENGTPVRAWVNEGKKVLSYRWRPDLIFPPLDRNFATGKRLLPEMDAYFVDVFASMGIFDFYSRDGQFHPRSETQTYWKKCFATIESALSTTDSKGEKHSGISISEAGNDSLIGSLSGADAQWRILSSKPRPDTIWFACENWERTPWFTAVNHTNFSRHGAGYSTRYEGGHMRDLHGITSDDYLASEILGGLDLMVDRGNLWPDAIRLHYYVGHIPRRLADKEIESVTFENDNIHQQTVLWSDGTKVSVNLDDECWETGGYRLPKYGFVVHCGDGQFLAGLVCNPQNDQERIELSENDGGFYLCGRGYKRSDVAMVYPEFAGLEVVDGRRFKVAIDWHAEAPVDTDYHVFTHLFSASTSYQEGWFAGGGAPAIPTSAWGIKDDQTDTTTVRTSGEQVLTIPDGLPNGDYSLLVGLFDAEGDGRRAALLAEGANNGRYTIAKIHLEREGDGYRITATKTPLTVDDKLLQELPQLFGNTTPATYRGVTTSGAVVGREVDGGLNLLVIPVAERFPVTVDESVWGTVEGIRHSGQAVDFSRDGQLVTFDASPDSEPYCVDFSNASVTK
ncbi:MAG: hypothetical protein Q4G68_09440 [Planctomycetia bacterium]|nr:hypothetical protein [Planctomycetia bacterium]